MADEMHHQKSEHGSLPSPPSISQKEAERIVRDAAKFFGIVKSFRVTLISNEEAKKLVGTTDDVQACCRFDPDQSDCDIYLTDLARDPVHSLYHEVAHLAFIDLHVTIERLREVEEKLVDYFSFLAVRRKRKSRAKRP